MWTKECPWEQTLSGGEKQRLAFARLLIHRPDLIVMDESTSALDPPSQEKLLQLISDKLPNATVISVGHRPELEAYHGRKLVLEHQPGGARLIRDEYLNAAAAAGARLYRWLGRRRNGEKIDQTKVDSRSSDAQKLGRPVGPVIAKVDPRKTSATKVIEEA